MPDWLSDRLLDLRTWFAFAIFLGKGFLLFLQFGEYRRNQKLIDVGATIGSNGTVQIEIANRSNNHLSVGGINLVQDKSRWAFFKRRYIFGLERFASMNIVAWRGPDKKLKNLKKRSSKTRYFEIEAVSDDDRLAKVAQLRSWWLRQTMIRVEVGGFRILSKVEFVDAIIATGRESKNLV